MAESSEGRVTKRKAHTKSRRGCFQCKQRHTKCNEARPRCGNCVRLDIYCTWPMIQDSYSNPIHPVPAEYITVMGESCSTGTPETTESGHGFELSIPDLRLLSHWMSKCHNSMSPNPSAVEDEEYWRDHFLEIAFDFPFLLHGYLAMSAVHKAISDPSADRQNILAQADSHISRGLAIYRRHLEAPILERAVPMFMMSTALFTYNLGSAQLERPEDPIAAIHHCFRLLAGVKMVVVPFWPQIKDTKVFSRIQDLAEGDNVETLDLRAKDDKIPEILSLMELTECILDARDRELCVSAINELHCVALRFRHASLRSDEYALLLGWAAMLTDHFVGLVFSHNPVACIILCHWAALLAQGRPVWWVGSWPLWILTACEQLLATTPDMLKWLDWPKKIISARAWSLASTPTAS